MRVGAHEVIPETSPIARLLAEQADEIASVRQLRSAAIDLRMRVSHGKYGDVELQDFWSLVASASETMWVSNPQLGKRAGLGDDYFSSVTRDRRRPKLANFLKATTAIIEIADELLTEVDGSKSGDRPDVPLGMTADLRISHDSHDLLKLALSLASLAREQIAVLSQQRANDLATIESNKKQLELLELFADGFEQIANALAAVAHRPNDTELLRKTRSVVSSVGDKVNDWWAVNGGEAIDWSMRLSFFTAGVAGLGWAGANMTIATSAVAALVGGSKVVKAIKESQRAE